MSLVQTLTIDLIAFLKQFLKSLKRDSSVNKFKTKSVGLFYNTFDIPLNLDDLIALDLLSLCNIYDLGRFKFIA